MGYSLIKTEVLTGYSNVNWPIKQLYLFLLFQLSALVALALNDVKKVDSVIKTKISDLVDLGNLGPVQSVQTRQIGPYTLFTYNFFTNDKHQVSAKATQFIAFIP